MRPNCYDIPLDKLNWWYLVVGNRIEFTDDGTQHAAAAARSSRGGNVGGIDRGP